LITFSLVCICKTRRFGLQVLLPSPGDVSFDEWWCFVSEATNDLLQQGLNSLIILGAWTFGYIRITVCLMVFPQAWLLHLTACRRKGVALGHGWGASALIVECSCT